MKKENFELLKKSLEQALAYENGDREGYRVTVWKRLPKQDEDMEQTTFVPVESSDSEFSTFLSQFFGRECGHRQAHSVEKLRIQN